MCVWCEERRKKRKREKRKESKKRKRGVEVGKEKPGGVSRRRQHFPFVRDKKTKFKVGAGLTS